MDHFLKTIQKCSESRLQEAHFGRLFPASKGSLLDISTGGREKTDKWGVNRGFQNQN
jgi:hypothetical protein